MGAPNRIGRPELPPEQAGLGFTVGQAVRLRVTAWDQPDGDTPGGVFGERGDKVIVKKIGPSTLTHPIAVHHEHITDGSTFNVSAHEINGA